MTQALFREDAYRQNCEATVVAVVDVEGGTGVILDRTVCYPQGGGQPGDTGHLTWPGGAAAIANAIKGEAPDQVVHLLDGDAPPQGATVTVTLDWDRRLRHMRVHTALHLLSVVIPLPVTGGQISAQKGRLDFDMADAPEDKQAIEDALNALIGQDNPVTDEWITDAELAANPDMVKTMSVMPPMGQGHVRLVRIGADPDAPVDLQPCGGTHVATTAQIGRIRLGKIEKKGKQNRRVSILID